MIWQTLALAAGLQSMRLEAQDGTTLAALGGAVSGKGAVVFVPELNEPKEGWQELGGMAFQAGLTAVALDLRGQGENPSLGERSLGDFLAMSRDVAAGISWARAQGADKVCLVGAELGASLALRAAADDSGIACVGMLSPSLIQEGISSEEALNRYGNRPLLIAASQDDPYGLRSAEALNRQAKGEHQLLVFPDAGHGTRMLRRVAALSSTILGFLRYHLQA
jgi:alpha-beta hydrolase superfamily lysophospholipase